LWQLRVSDFHGRQVRGGDRLGGGGVSSTRISVLCVRFQVTHCSFLACNKAAEQFSS